MLRPVIFAASLNEPDGPPMLENSVITRTGQMWKFVLAVGLTLAGCIVPLFPATGMSWTVGTVLAFVGYGFGLAFIRCPECGQRWFWDAALDASLYAPLFTQPSCPACSFEFGH